MTNFICHFSSLALRLANKGDGSVLVLMTVLIEQSGVFYHVDFIGHTKLCKQKIKSEVMFGSVIARSGNLVSISV